MKKLNKNSMFSDVAFVSASKFVTYAISLVSSMLLSRFRTLNEYGTYSQMLLIVNVATTLFMLGLPASINYFLAQAETKEERNRFLSIYYIINTVLSFLVGLILMLAIPLIEIYFKNPNIGKYFFFLGLYPWTKIISSSVENLLIVHRKNKFLVTYRFAHSILLVLVILLVKVLSWTFMSYVLLYLGVEIAFAVLVYIVAVRLDGAFIFRIDWQDVKKIFVFAIPLGLSTAAGTLKAEMDKLVIGYFLSTEEYAIYANAAKELPITFISSSITAVLLPIIVRLVKKGDMSKAMELWHDTTIMSYLMNAFFAIGLFTFSREAMTFLYSEKYESGYFVFGLYSLVLLFRSTYFGLILQATGQTKKILKSSIISLIINFVLNIVLFYSIGFPGPAVSTLIATAWSAGYLLYTVSKTTNVKFRNVFPWKKIGQITGVNVALGIVFYFVRHRLPLEHLIGVYGETFFLAGCWLIVYALIFRKDIKEKMRVIRNQT